VERKMIGGHALALLRGGVIFFLGQVIVENEIWRLGFIECVQETIGRWKRWITCMDEVEATNGGPIRGAGACKIKAGHVERAAWPGRGGE
jgi:hypothetical protein